jgi:CRISPR system Cascade subunit CasC
MLIEIHMIKNHSPSNLNRDDLGAPKTCYFGGVLRSRISSQCLKRSIRMSEEFRDLLGGIRTRQLAKLIADKVTGKLDMKKRAAEILEKCGIAPKDTNKSDMLVYTTNDAITRMANLLRDGDGKTKDQLALEFGEIISKLVDVPDIALSGRMLETGILKDTTVDAALQVAHAISTHEARPEVDYYVAADDIPGDDAGAAYVDEAMFSSACFYKYFSINWEDLIKNLRGSKELAAHTVGAFLRGASLVTPSGKQNSFAAHNCPSGIMIEFRNNPISYANAFVEPAVKGERDLISQSIAQLAQYVYDIEVGFGGPKKRLWFSPNLRHSLACQKETADQKRIEEPLNATVFPRIDDLVTAAVKEIGCDWQEVQKIKINKE